MPTCNIAIIGGGCAGLTQAYYLVEGEPVTRSGDAIKCVVYDSSERLGGNASSAYMENAYKAPFGELGVNDFNIDQYDNFKKILETLKNDFEVPYECLCDTTCFHTPSLNKGGMVSYTADEMTQVAKHLDDRRRIPSPCPLQLVDILAKKPYLKPIVEDWDKFKREAHNVLNDTSGTYKRKNGTYMTVSEFGKKMGFSDEFMNYNLLARINGMYYCTDEGVGEMPILAVLNYYHLQENIGGDPSKKESENPRKYFKHGASQWIKQLVGYLSKKNVEFKTGKVPDISSSSGKWVIKFGDETETRTFDKVISAVHADVIPKVFSSGLTGEMYRTFNKVKYLSSMSVLHSDSTLLPANIDQWSSYNILIHPLGETLRPYTISYCCKKHQGENSNEPPYITCTPYRPADELSVRQMVPIKTGREDDGKPCETKVLAKQFLRHNMFNKETFEAQAEVLKYNNKDSKNNNLYFTGGWTHGAGLHEDCCMQAIANKGRICESIEIAPDFHLAGEHFDVVPDHIKRTTKKNLA